MIWYMLRCDSCAVNFEPLRSDTPDELLSGPDDQTDSPVFERLREFREKHSGHALREVKEEVEMQRAVWL